MLLFAPIVLATVASATVQNVGVSYSPPRAAYPAQAQSGETIGYALADWRRLRSSNGYAFADYARFLAANPDWPG